MGLTLTMLESPPALQAITKLPDVLKAHAISQAAFRLAASISERKYGNVYPRANDLLQAVENTQIPDADFQAVVGSLLRKFTKVPRREPLFLISMGDSMFLEP